MLPPGPTPAVGDSVGFSLVELCWLQPFIGFGSRSVRVLCLSRCSCVRLLDDALCLVEAKGRFGGVEKLYWSTTGDQPYGGSGRSSLSFPCCIRTMFTPPSPRPLPRAVSLSAFPPAASLLRPRVACFLSPVLVVALRRRLLPPVSFAPCRSPCFRLVAFPPCITFCSSLYGSFVLAATPPRSPHAYAASAL